LLCLLKRSSTLNCRPPFASGGSQKRRASAIAVIKAGIVSGELPSRIDPDILLDVLYGGLYYRLLIGTGAISDDYVDSVWDTVAGGLGEQ
jgi:hypothetical protein